jgi:hypothetical protein
MQTRVYLLMLATGAIVPARRMLRNAIVAADKAERSRSIELQGQINLRSEKGEVQ